MGPEAARHWGAGLFLLLAAGLVLYAVVFVVWVFLGGTVELGIDQDAVGVTREEIEALSPSLMHYIDHLHVAVGGFMLGLGLSIGGLAWYGVRGGHRWALGVLLAAAVAALVVATPLHYVHGFTSLTHIGPLYGGLLLAAAATMLSWRGLRSPGVHGKP